MADILCGYTADRDETLVAYLYGDIEPVQRAAFDAHIATCERCRQELAELRDVRGRLESWTAPEATGTGSLVRLPVAAFTEAPSFLTAPHERPDRWRALREVPAWAQAAAAILVLGVSAGLAGAIAHLDVRYGQEGLSVRTGWSRTGPAAAAPAASSPAAPIVLSRAGAATPWTGDLDALEQRLRAVIRSSAATASAATVSAATAQAARGDAAAAADAQLLLKVKALLDDSERKQRNELALRIAEVVEEFDAKRGSDLANIRNMKTIQSVTAADVARQQQLFNYYLMRTSMQK